MISVVGQSCVSHRGIIPTLPAGAKARLTFVPQGATTETFGEKKGGGARAPPPNSGPAQTGGSQEFYIPMPMPPMSPPPGIGFSASGMSVTNAEVVKIMAAMEQAFSTALRVTLAGSMMPASSIST